jgi:hypothetical protein
LKKEKYKKTENKIREAQKPIEEGWRLNSLQIPDTGWGHSPLCQGFKSPPLSFHRLLYCDPQVFKALKIVGF